MGLNKFNAGSVVHGFDDHARGKATQSDLRRRLRGLLYK
jgi:hypothetical protein